MSKQPWMKFYPADWRADPALRMCEPISRYVWLEMIGLMHDAEPYGHLVINGQPITDEALSRLIDVDLKTLRRCLKELARNGVFSVDDSEIIFSRRMVRDDLKASSNRENGAKGGNPVLKNQGHSTVSVNPKDNQDDKARAIDTIFQKPDTRNKTSPNGEDTRKALSPSQALDAEFSEAFWPRYPHKVGKPVALKAYRSARKKTEQAEIMAGLDAYVSKTDDRPWCNPATWLNQERWADQPSEVQRGPPKPTETRHQAHRRDALDAFNELLGVAKHDEFDGHTIELQANG